MNCLQLFLTWCSRTYLCLPSLSPDTFIAECKSSCKPCRESLPPTTFLLHVCDCSYCFQISHLACSAQVLGASAQVPPVPFPRKLVRVVDVVLLKLFVLHQVLSRGDALHFFCCERPLELRTNRKGYWLTLRTRVEKTSIDIPGHGHVSLFMSLPPPSL